MFGVIKQIVLLPAAPLRFTVWVADKVAEEADKQEFSSGAAVQKIDEVEEKRERGEIDEEEAAEIEGELLEQQAERAQPGAAPEEGDANG